MTHIKYVATFSLSDNCREIDFPITIRGSLINLFDIFYLKTKLFQKRMFFVHKLSIRFCMFRCPHVNDCKRSNKLLPVDFYRGFTALFSKPPFSFISAINT